MKNLKLVIATIVIALSISSCYTTYTWQKVVVNDSNHDVIVHSGCCNNEEDILVPAHERVVVFICGYQSFEAPNCEDLDGKFDFNSSEYVPSKDIESSSNWFNEQNGKIISCVFTIDNEDEK